MSTPPPGSGDQQDAAGTPQPDPTSEQHTSQPDPAWGQSGQQGTWQQNAYQQGAYQGQQGAYQYQTSRPTNSMALVSMIAGIAGLSVVPLIGSIVALVTGRIARREMASSGEDGAGMATAGIIMGWIGVGIGVLVLLFFIAIFVFAFAASTSSM